MLAKPWIESIIDEGVILCLPMCYNSSPTAKFSLSHLRIEWVTGFPHSTEGFSEVTLPVSLIPPWLVPQGLSVWAQPLSLVFGDVLFEECVFLLALGHAVSLWPSLCLWVWLAILESYNIMLCLGKKAFVLQ